VLEVWQLGTRGKDNGVLVTVSKGDRQVRIDVGSGLERALTREQAERIIDDTLTPAFRAGRFGDGLRQAALEILSAAGSPADAGAELPLASRPLRTSIAHRVRAVFGSFQGFLALLVLAIMVILIVRALFGSSPIVRRSRWGSSWWGRDDGWDRDRTSSSWGSSSGSRWGSGSSSSGGSWSGGGGGFSGGGSSGSW
jgi:uncharacterized protein